MILKPGVAVIMSVGWDYPSDMVISVFHKNTFKKQGNYSLRRPPKLIIPQIFIEQRWATVIEFISV